MARKRRQEIDTTVQSILGSRSEKAKEPNPVGVKLTEEEIETLNQIAQELGVIRHHLLQYAVRDFLARYKRGEKPRIVEKTIKVLEPED